MNILRNLSIRYDKTPVVFPEDGRRGIRYQLQLGWWPWIIAAYVLYRLIRGQLQAGRPSTIAA